MYDAEYGFADDSWEVMSTRDPFLKGVGPLLTKSNRTADRSEPVRIGLRVRPEHCNFFGICHGGMIGTMMDVALGLNSMAATGAPHTLTISLSIDFVRAAEVDAWIESRVRIVRQTSRTIFLDGLLIGPEGPVARGNAVFKVPSIKARSL